jgi:septum formation protein
MRPEALVIGADTVAWCSGEIIGKPADRADAVRILTLMTSSVHSVVTGLWLVTPDGREASDCVSTELKMRDLSQDQIEVLVDLPGALDAAGAYRIQDEDPNIVSLRGSVTNVKGLPLGELRALITELYPSAERGR